jgi:hypothetical protein
VSPLKFLFLIGIVNRCTLPAKEHWNTGTLPAKVLTMSEMPALLCLWLYPLDSICEPANKLTTVPNGTTAVSEWAMCVSECVSEDVDVERTKLLLCWSLLTLPLPRLTCPAHVTVSCAIFDSHQHNATHERERMCASSTALLWADYNTAVSRR